MFILFEGEGWKKKTLGERGRMRGAFTFPAEQGAGEKKGSS